MKIVISKSEEYPVFRAREWDTESGEKPIEISDDKMAWIKRVEKEEDEVNTYLCDLYYKGRDD